MTKGLKGLILLADGFEDTEAIVTIDILRRAGIGIDSCSVTGQDRLLTQSGNRFTAEKLLKEVNWNNYDFLVIPGGKAVNNVLSRMKAVEKIILRFHRENKLIASICAAPSLLGKAGLFKNKKFTCYPGFEKEIEGKYTGGKLEKSGNLITARSMGYTIEFALAVVDYLKGRKEAKKTKAEIYAK